MVLCVDDEHGRRYARSRTLEAEGFDVIEAANGEDALRLAFEQRPALIVLDIRLPDLNGFEVCKRLKSAPETAGIPVLHVSAVGRMENDLPEALEHQSDAYLREPIEPETLVATAKALIRAHDAERRQREAEARSREAIRISEAKYRALVETALEGIWVVDATGRTEFVNRRMAEMLKYSSPEELIGRFAFDFVADAERPSIDTLTGRLPAADRERYETHLRCSDGSMIWVSVSQSNLRDEQGHPVGRMALLMDITERKAAQDQLLESQRRLELAVDAAELGTWEVDLDSGMVSASARTCAMFGFESAAPRIQDWAARVHPDDRERVSGQIEQAREQRTRYEAEYRVVARDGSIRWIFAKAVPLVNGEGRVTRLVGVAQDILSRKTAEQDRERERELLQGIVQNIPVMLCLYDPALRRFELNQEAQRVLGWSNADANDGDFMTRVYPDPSYRRIVADYMQTLAPGWREWNATARDGSAIPSEWANIRLSDDRLIGIGIDLRARKQAENALRESEHQFRIMGETVPYGVWLCGPDGGVRYCSQSFLDLIQMTQAEQQQFGWTSRIVAEDVEPVITKWRHCCSTGSPWEHEHRIIDRNGEIVTILSKGLPVRDAAGNITCWVGVNLDITDRKRSEQQLRKSEARFRSVVESNIIGVVFADPVSGTIHDANDEYLRIIGRSREDLLAGKLNWKHITAADSLREAEGIIATTTPGQRFAPYEKECVRPDGSRAQVIIGGSYLDDAGRHAVAFVLDNTERKRAEERLRRTQKLESVGLLAGGIAHDFNNLLTGIMGNASMVLDDIDAASAERIRDVITSAERAANLTRQLLAYAGKGQFILRELDVSEAVHEIANLVEFSLPKSVQLAVNLQRRLPAVRMDPSQLQQILMNLVINAGEAIGAGKPGRVMVSTSMIDLENPFVDAMGEEIMPGRYICVAVSDTGSGMAEETISKIFDPFFSTKFTGRGLGLAAVAGILRSQKGGITVQSTLGSGSTFRVYLPVAEQRASRPDRSKVDESLGAILIVDDEVSVREFIAAALRRKGYRVLLASDGREALSVCDRESGGIDALVLDVVMPVMGANDLLPRLKSRRPEVKVLLTSGYSEDEARRLCVAYPGAAFIQKPYTAQQIVAAVDELLGGRHSGRRERNLQISVENV